MSDMLDSMIADTITILAEWADSIVVRSNVIDLTHAIPVDSWGREATYIGDWQPYRGQRPGKDIVSEAGQKDEYLSVIYLPTGAIIGVGDRMYKNDTYFEYVSVIDAYKDHIEVFTKRNQNSV